MKNKNLEQIYFMLIFISLYIFFLITYFYAPNINIPQSKYDVYDIYEYYSELYGNYDYIQDVVKTCRNDENTIYCVFLEIPMDYDYSRVGQNEPIFRTPSDYPVFGGVCRDYSVYRHSTLKQLGVNCLFNFHIDNHVYLTCYHDGMFYELNNDQFYVHE